MHDEYDGAPETAATREAAHLREALRTVQRERDTALRRLRSIEMAFDELHESATRCAGGEPTMELVPTRLLEKVREAVHP